MVTSSPQTMMRSGANVGQLSKAAVQTVDKYVSVEL